MAAAEALVLDGMRANAERLVQVLELAQEVASAAEALRLAKAAPAGAPARDPWGPAPEDPVRAP